MGLTAESVKQAQDGADPWRVGNQVLYDLCQRCPDHDDDAKIIAKVWLIGRAYSASIERGKGDAVGADVPNDVFYIKHVAPALRASALDRKVAALKQFKVLDRSSVTQVLDTHGYLVTLFETLTHKSKRSLASKYLHFHCPDLFFIYDSRAALSIRRLAVAPLNVDAPNADEQYAKFFGAALGLTRHVSKKFKTRLTPRQLDRLLLATFADPSQMTIG
ncbi:MAG: hypothetical protein Q7J25_11385 [Vicinamibacterales bacterium]|nr:hypothetical protein [Vicinamibacterales bacterium]